MRPADFLAGYLLPLLPLALLQGIAVYAVSLLLGLPLTGRVAAALLAGMIPALLYIALGLLCGSLLNDRQVGGICGALLTNLSAWLSGIWFDISLMGSAFGAVCKVLPFYHAVEGCRDALAGAPAAWGHLAVVGGYAVGLMAFAAWVVAGKMKGRG